MQLTSTRRRASTGSSRSGAANAPDLIYASEAMAHVRRQAERLGPTDCTVLVHGETGTGKELIARSIHAASPRRRRPFVPVDCAALPETLAESQLFGHVRGAFTGADHETIGFIRAADGGTLFLDEIGELPATSQARLLRCIQERTVTPVGSVEPIAVDIRIVSATHRDLVTMADEQRFRSDLLYRLEVATIDLPPLRERPDDVPALADHFLRRFAERYGQPVKRFAAEAHDVLVGYHWPGNVRQLSNAIEHAVVFSRSAMVTTDDLPRRIRSAKRAAPPADATLRTHAQAERELVAEAMKVAEGNQSRAARLIQVERHRLQRMIKRHGLESLKSTKPTDA